MDPFLTEFYKQAQDWHERSLDRLCECLDADAAEGKSWTDETIQAISEQESHVRSAANSAELKLQGVIL